MAHEIRIPRLGWSMEVGTFVAWLKQDGDLISEGDLLYELESDKASQEMEAIDAGVLRIPPDAPQPGSELPVGALLGYLLEPDEPVPWAANSKTDAAAGVESAGKTVTARPVASPAVRRLARDLAVTLDQVRGTGQRGRITREDVERNASQDARSVQTRVIATPRARRVARELAIDWSQLEGTGRNGRIRECDIRQAHAALSDRRTTPAQAASTHMANRMVPNRRRRAIADRMLMSQQTTVPVTLTTLAKADKLQSARRQFKSTGERAIVPTINDMIIKLVAGVLQHHRLLAARWDGDEIALPAADEINVGLAVDTEEGLLVPVIRDAGRNSLTAIAKSSVELVERARAGNLSLDQLQGGVFTVTSLGPFGIDAFTPVINPPESAILGIGALRREAMVDESDRIAVGTRMTLSLTFDHRIIDGGPAARFLAEVRAAIEDPLPVLT